MTEQLESAGHNFNEYGKNYFTGGVLNLSYFPNETFPDYAQGWALKSSHTTFGLNSVAKKLATEYFHAQRALNPPRRAEAGYMRTKLLNEIDSSDPTGTKYLLEYSEVPSEKQLTSLFSRLEKTRIQG